MGIQVPEVYGGTDAGILSMISISRPVRVRSEQFFVMLLVLH